MIFTLLKELNDVTALYIGVRSLNNLGNEHLYDTNHATPACITFAGAGNGSIRHPDGGSEVLHEFTLIFIVISFTQQVGWL